MNHPIYPNLFSPLKVNKLVLKNRIISAPLGSLTDKSTTYIGMIIRGTSGNVNDGKSRITPGKYCFADIYESSKVREQVSVIRQRGAKAEFELCHTGQYACVDKGDFALGPISFIREDGTEVREMDKKMMDQVADKFAEAALDAKEYGFDMVMLHFGHGWLPAQFLSPYFNKRTDEYGGCFENRIKFPTAIIERVRKAVGSDYPLDMRISGIEHVDGGMDIDEVVAFIKSVEDKIDMVHISCGLERNLEAMVKMTATTYLPHKINIELSRKVKEVVKIPVAVVGSIMTPEEGEEIIASGAADAVVIGRQIIADPFFVQKAWEGRSEDIVPCLRCLNCYNSYQQGKESSKGMKCLPNCAVNPRYLHEDRVPVMLEKAENRRKVVIIGGGPAGCKAALTAFERGHEVVLFEKEKFLGGQIYCSEFDESKVDLKRYKNFLVNQINKTDIKVVLNTKATPEMIEKLSPDSIVLALGAEPVMPKIPGSIENNAISAIDAYQKIDQLGKDIVIVGGGGIGCELAAHLAEIGKNVSVVELTGRLNPTANQHVYIGLRQKMDRYKNNLKVYLNTECKEITSNEVIVADKNNNEFSIKADNVILAIGMRSRKLEANSFFGIVQDTNIIGDANRPATVWEATQDGYYIAAKL